VSATSRPDGSVVLEIQAPAAGAVHAEARAAVKLDAGHPRSTPHRRRGGRRASRGTRTARAARGHARRSRHPRATPAVWTRTVAAASTRSSAEGTAQLVLVLAFRYHTLAAAPGGLSASVTVTFAAPGHPTLRQSVPVTFLNTKRRARRSSTSARRARRADLNRGGPRR
jgi:hypothetical protein